MKKRKKHHSSIPRHKRLSRDSRLNAAKQWISKYEGINIVTGYSKHFAVNSLCAIAELEILGLTFDPAYVEQLKKTEEQRVIQNQRRRELNKEKELETLYPESDENFYYIDGYTSGGAPYGITWGEMGLCAWVDPDEEDIFL